jgi:Ser/Thr protein kinase RdoA (MazF antagonist)
MAAVDLDDARDEPALLAPERDYLAERMADVESRLQAIESVLGWGVIHNDAHRGNLLASHESPSPHVLTDWDGVCLGPREIDLVQEGAPGGRFTLPETQRLAFCRRYGFDLATWPGHATLREARELHSLAAYIRLAPTKPPAATELHARLADLLGQRTRTWRPVR